jgi:integrase/recombinase XerD
MKKIEMPKIPQKVPKIPSKDHIEILFDYIYNKRHYRNKFEKKTFQIFFDVKYNTMARIDEMLKIRIKDIDFKENRILIRGKGNKERYTYPSKTTFKRIKEYIKLANLKNGDLLIRNRFNKPAKIRTLHHRVKTIVQEVDELEDWMTSHPLLRKAPASFLLNNGFTLSEVQDLLGHSDPKTTRIYAQASQQKLKEKLAKKHPLELQNTTN